MSDKTAIEWTDATWNPVTGCTKVSPGCDHCYAETIAHRFAGTPAYPDGFEPTLRPERLDQPLRWKKPRRIFVNSMADLFHDQVPDLFITRIFDVMEQAHWHTFQLLTKRHARMRSFVQRRQEARENYALAFENHEIPERRTCPAAIDARRRADNPPANIWLGVSVENQQWADIRIPALLETPAAVRFLSCEPLLGPVDLAAWIPPRTPVAPASAPETWAAWEWPSWVPSKVRQAIEEFWSEQWGRGPHAWLRSAYEQQAPAFGATVTLDDGFGPNPPKVTGRFVHAWNNIGRLVMDDGTFRYTSFSRAEGRPALDWVIVGGESGHGARLMQLDWARSLRDQCVAAGVSFHFKQFGEWAPTDVHSCGSVSDPKERQGELYPDEKHPGLPWRRLYRRVGKKAAGRELDGRTWDEYPRAVS